MKELIEKLWSDFKMSPKSIKISMICLVIITLFLSTMFILGCSYGPSKEFVLKMDERAIQHFARYKTLIENATTTQLEQILKKEPGAFSKASKADLDFLKDSLKSEIDAWQYLIQTNKQLLEKK